MALQAVANSLSTSSLDLGLARVVVLYPNHIVQFGGAHLDQLDILNRRHAVLHARRYLDYLTGLQQRGNHVTAVGLPLHLRQAAVNVNVLVLPHVILEARPIAFPELDDLERIDFRLSDPELPAPRFLNDLKDGLLVQSIMLIIRM